MSRSLSYIFPAGNTTDVCLLQTLGVAGNLTINGNLANLVNGQVSFIQKGYSRQISLTSVNNLSGRQFTITGMQNGITITENVTGPNNNTVYSVQVYDVISSISVDGAVNGVSVGTGYIGFFPLIAINLERPIISYSLAITPDDTTPTIVYNTLYNIVGIDTFLEIEDDTKLFEIKANDAENNQYFLPIQNVVPCQYILVKIEGTAGTIGNEVFMNFIQV